MSAERPRSFFGRGNEIKKLEYIYNSGKFECVAVHGRLRVGTTALIREFIKGKKAACFSARETSSVENLGDLSRALSVISVEAGLSGGISGSYEEAFEAAFEAARSERLVLVVDDYQFLVASHRGISKTICDQIDLWGKDSLLMLVICGNSEPVMVRETLGFDSPFHGRRTAQIKLDPFTFFDVKRYYDTFSPFDAAVLYGVTGGVPAYLELMDPELPIEENIRRAFFDASSILYEEPVNFLRRETREPAYYNAVLRAIAEGSSKNSEIALKTGLETSACTAYLNNLIALGLVAKHTPVTEKAGKRTAYEIKDDFFRFWYRFIPVHVSLIQSGMADKIWRNVAREIPSFMGKVFGDICRQWMEQQNQADLLPVRFIEIGRWWGVDPVWKTDVFIPIVAYSDDDHCVFGDCVWSDDPAGADALGNLIENSRLFRYNNRHLYLFSRSGFSDECIDLAGRAGANLVTFE